MNASEPQALREFIELWRSPDLAQAVAISLTCLEVDALAALLRQQKEGGSADEWLAKHAVGDDPVDSHFAGS